MDDRTTAFNRAVEREREARELEALRQRAPALKRERDELLEALDADHSHEGGLPRPDCSVCALLRKLGRLP